MDAFLTGIGLGMGVGMVSALVGFFGYDVELFSIRKRAQR